jgi:hypothetical protein
VSRKISLPLHGKLLDLVAPPTIDVVRARLGGRASAGAPIGEVVRIGDAVPPRAGVVLSRENDVVDVLVEQGTVRRTRGSDVRPWLQEIPDELREIARDVRVFGELREGQAVRFAAEGAVAEPGTLLEKCRWGALVQRADGVVVGVGFRRVVPAPPRGAAN